MRNLRFPSVVSLADNRLGLTEAMPGGIVDPRDQGKVEHHIVVMARERIYAMSLTSVCAGGSAIRGLEGTGTPPTDGSQTVPGWVRGFDC